MSKSAYHLSAFCHYAEVSKVSSHVYVNLFPSASYGTYMSVEHGMAPQLLNAGSLKKHAYD